MASRVSVLLVVLLALAGCTVPRPVGDAAVTVPDDTQIRAIVEQHRAVYEIARESGEPRVAELVETGAVLEATESAARWHDFGDDVEIVETFRPSFESYPMWFGVTVEAGDDRWFEVYERSEAVARWRLSARVVVTDEWPEVERDDGLVRALDSSDAADIVGDLAGAGTVASAASDELENVTIEQLWHVESVPAVMALDGGGSLVVAALRRTDHVTVDAGLTVTWPTGSVMQERWPDGLSGFDTLETLHMWAVHVPASGEPQVLDHSGWSGASR